LRTRRDVGRFEPITRKSGSRPVVSLHVGERWQAKIQEAILDADVFYLFWSQSASESEWVEFEWRFALEARGLNFIAPAPLMSPERTPPPQELSEINFRDWTVLRGHVAERAKQREKARQELESDWRS
jgi:hypothetical protein